MKLVLERFAHNALALLAVTTILFFMFRLMPGTPLGRLHQRRTSTPTSSRRCCEQFGLDRPMWQQYFIYLGNLLTRRDGPVVLPAPAGHRPSCSRCCPTRSSSPCASLIIAYIFGVLAGAWLAWKRGSWLERVAVPVVLATRAAPEFWIGMVLLALLPSISAGSRPAAPAAPARPTPATGSASSRSTTCSISRCR